MNEQPIAARINARAACRAVGPPMLGRLAPMFASRSVSRQRSWASEMQQCRLCLHDRKLCDSHIIPEFLYTDLYNDDRQMVGVTGRGKKGWKPLQKGATERLFCESCEQHLSNFLEGPFKSEWIDKSPLPDPWPSDHIEVVKVNDYPAFKLFHLSVVFRAGISSLPTFSEVQLGQHEERLRKLLLNRDPGRADRYPVFGYAVVRHDNQRIVPMVSRTQGSHFDTRPCYGTTYGGVQWWVRVTSSAHQEFQSISLKEDGTMPITSIPWNEVSVIQDARRALRRADASQETPSK